MASIALRGGWLVTMDGKSIERGDIAIVDGKITGVGKAPKSDLELDVRDHAVLPGFIQAHTHVCQTLCRGNADDLPLLDWLTQRVWPYEASLDDAAMQACVRLACAELLLSGTTTILDMGTVHGTDVLAETIGKTGLRATIGKAMMDDGQKVPKRLREKCVDSLKESDRLAQSWAGRFDGRIRYAYAPRFVLSCTDKLLREVGERVQAGARLHTHASEQESEIKLVRKERGKDNIDYFDEVGLLGERSVLAHCVHATRAEQTRLAKRGAHVAHCPSSNLKLGSGIAPVPEMLERGINVALGADGAPCNNNLDQFVELRLAGLIHKPRVGPAKMTAQRALELATINGARALGIEKEIGSITVGKRADLTVVALVTPHSVPHPDVASSLVYAAQSRDVRHVLVDGRFLVRNGALTAEAGLDLEAVVRSAQEHTARLSR